MVSSKRKQREIVPKTKTFTGCWTCRSRKVKCDGKRPECGRCLKGGHVCTGYDIKLYWITDGDDTAPSAIKRQAMNLTGFPLWSFHLDDVDRQLARIDACTNFDLESEQVSSGPFTVFASRQDFETISHDVEMLDIINDVQATEILDLQLLPLGRGDLQLQLLPALNPSIFRDITIDVLVSNYVLEVANVLTPQPHPQNPYASIYLPKALDGAAAVVSSLGCIPTNVSPGNVAVFYALLATSAFHLQRKEPDSDMEFDVLARRYRGKAIGFLRQALFKFSQNDNGSSSVDRVEILSTAAETTMSAMLNLITMDVMEGSMSEYRIHLDGIERFVTQLRNHSRLSPQIRRLMTIASFLTTIADATSIDKAPLTWSELDLEGVEVGDRDFDTGLEVTYGVTPTLFCLMRRLVALSRCISYYSLRMLDLPPPLYAACLEVSNSLSVWSIDNEPLTDIFTGPEMQSKLKVTQHHILAFAHSLRVYYHTRLLPCKPSDMASYVDLVAYHLIQIEEIKANASLDARMGTSLVWPGFIASCEASKGLARTVWYQWWDRMSSYSIGNIAQLWKVVQEAWALRDDEGLVEVPAWMPVLRRSGKPILAV